MKSLKACLSFSVIGQATQYNLKLVPFLRSGFVSSFSESPGYGTKQSDGEAPVMIELWGMRSTPSLPSLPRPL